MDFEEYFNKKISIDSLQKYPILSYELDTICNDYNSCFSAEYMVVIGKPSELKKMKIYDCKEFNFIKITNNKDSFKEFAQKLCDKFAEHYLVELEQLPVSVKTQNMLTDEFMRIARSCLDSKSPFLSRMEEIKNASISDSELARRNALISKVKKFSKFNSPAVVARIEKYFGASIENMNTEIKKYIERFPLGYEFIDKYCLFYSYDNRCWRDYSKHKELFKIINLIEKEEMSL